VLTCTEVRPVRPVSQRLYQYLVTITKFKLEGDCHQNWLHSDTCTSAEKVVSIVSGDTVYLRIGAIVLIPNWSLCPSECLEARNVNIQINLEKLISIYPILKREHSFKIRFELDGPILILLGEIWLSWRTCGRVSSTATQWKSFSALVDTAKSWLCGVTWDTPGLKMKIRDVIGSSNSALYTSLCCRDCSINIWSSYSCFHIPSSSTVYNGRGSTCELSIWCCNCTLNITWWTNVWSSWCWRCPKCVRLTPISYFYAILWTRDSASHSWLIINIIKLPTISCYVWRSRHWSSICRVNIILTDSRIWLEVWRVQSKWEILRVGCLICLPPYSEDRRCHIHSIVELLILAIWNLELFVHDTVMRRLCPLSCFGWCKGLVHFLESVRGLIISELFPALCRLEQKSADESSRADNSFHYYILNYIHLNPINI
jgi:hypothetical protein